MYRQIDSPHVGIESAYLPQGRMPYDVSGEIDGTTILRNGDPVTILSAWTRDYLPADAPTLYYVRSHNTGHATHVVGADLVGVGS